MGYTHYFSCVAKRGETAAIEAKYQRAMVDCQRIIKRFYAANGGLSGYSAHCTIGQYGGLNVNGKGSDACETFSMREHFSQNESFNFCKTRRCAYDIVVTACLATLKHRLGTAFDVSSDGDASDWTSGVELARRVTGLAIKNPLGKDRANSGAKKVGTKIA